MGNINSENIWNNAQAGYAAYTQATTARRAQTASVKQPDSVENLIKYLENKPIAQQTSDTFTSTVAGALPGVAIFEGPRGLGWLKKAHGLKVRGAVDALNVAHAAEAGSDAVSAAKYLRSLATADGGVTQSLKSIFQGGKDAGRLTTRVKNYMNSVNEFQTNSKKVTEALTSFRETEKAALKAAEASKAVNEVTKASKVAENVSRGMANVSQKLSQVKNLLGKPFVRLSEMFPKTAKFLKGSGAAGFAVIGGGIELATEVLPTFKQLGFKAGVKQTVKSAVKVASDIGGWAAGAKGGAAVGAAIGSIFPGVGTAIGAAVGTFLGGFIGSWGAGKIAKKLTGPTEREKAAEKATKEQTQTIMANSSDVQALKQLAYQKVQESIQQNGYIDADSQKALEEIEKLNNPFAKGSIYA